MRSFGVAIGSNKGRYLFSFPKIENGLVVGQVEQTAFNINLKTMTRFLPEPERGPESALYWVLGSHLDKYPSTDVTIVVPQLA